MLGTLLAILKIIGWVLLGILGVVLVLLFLVLFVPIRYRVRGEKYENGETPFSARADVTYLLHLVNARVLYPGEELLRVRVFVFRIFSKRLGGEERAEDTTEKKKKPKKTKKRKTDDEIGRAGEADADASTETFPDKENENVSSDDNTYAANADLTAQSTENPSATSDADGSDPASDWDEISFDSDSVEEQTGTADSPKGNSDSAPGTTPESVPESDTEQDEQAISDAENPTLSDFLDKLASFLRNIQFQITRICDKIKDIFENVEYYLDVVTSPAFERAFSLCKDELVKLLYAIRPRRIRGHIKFGAEEPDTTGKLLSVYAMLYPYIGRELSLTPYFDREIFTGELDLKGHITLFTVLVIAIKVYFNKDVRRTLRLLKKEKLHG